MGKVMKYVTQVVTSQSKLSLAMLSLAELLQNLLNPRLYSVHGFKIHSWVLRFKFKFEV